MSIRATNIFNVKLLIPLTYLPLQVRCLIRGGPWQDTWVTEASSQQCPQYKQKQSSSDDWDNGGQLLCQVLAAEENKKQIMKKEKQQNAQRNLKLKKNPPVLLKIRSLPFLNI